MLPPFNHNLTNWVDGMKISKEHFQALENYFLDAQRDVAAIQLTDYNYGLLFEGSDYQRTESPYQITVDSEKVEVKRCRAITPAGTRIEILNDGHPHLRKPLSEMVDIRNSTAQYLYVVLTVDPFKRIPGGEPSVEESPFRFPKALPTYRLDVIPAEQLSSSEYAANSIPIAKINKSFNGYEVDQRYIPPCTKVRSVSDMHSFFEQQGNLIKDLSENTLLEIMKKVREKRRQNQPTQLSEDIGDLAFSIIQYCVNNIDEYRQILREQPPVYMVLWFVKLARQISNQYIHARNRDNLLKYLSSYTGTQGGQIEANTDRLCSMKYNHLDIRSALDAIQSLTDFWTTLFNRLRDLNFTEFAQQSMIEKTVHINNPNVNNPPVKNPPPQAPTTTSSSIVITGKGGNDQSGHQGGGGGGFGLID